MPDGKLDRDPYYSDLMRRFVRFAVDNQWYDSMASYYTPKQNLYRYMTGDDWCMRSNRDRLNFHPGSFSEMDLMLTAKGY
jgi:hypothetical protein